MKRLALFLLVMLSSLGSAQTLATVDAITFFDQPNVLYLPARDAAKLFGWRLALGADGKTVYLNQKPVRSRVRELADGSALVPLSEFKRRGFSVSRQGKEYKVRIKKRAFYVREGTKRVVVNKSHMEMRAWQGQRVVLAAPVTLGVEGKDTPSGLFKAEGNRSKMHKSKLYHDAPMPWSVHIVGNVFIHGWKHVQGGRGSHGCIRLPMSGGNPARFFYYWVDKGTPVSILGKWPRGAKINS